MFSEIVVLNDELCPNSRSKTCPGIVFRSDFVENIVVKMEVSASGSWHSLNAAMVVVVMESDFSFVRGDEFIA